jgi:hypothetical protein
LNLPGQGKREIPVEGDAHQKIDNMEGGKKKEHPIEGPLSDTIHLKEDGLEEKEKEADPNHLAGNHHEEVWPVRHTPHEADFDEKEKERKIAAQTFRPEERG